MLHIIRVFSVLIFSLLFLYACGGQSSGESTGSSSSNTSTPSITPPSNSTALSGQAFYSNPSLGCVACHGENGQGVAAFPAINTITPDTCPSCTDVGTLAASIQSTMPIATGSPSDCTGTSEGTCAHDIAVYMLESWFTSGSSITPPPSPGVIVAPVSGISTSEDGTTASFAVRLSTEPSDDVNIDITIDDITEGSLASNPVTLTFNETNWNVDQTVIVTGVDDGDIDGPITYTAITSTTVTADTNYMGINPDDVSIVNTDNEVFVPAGITVNPISGLTTNENGGTASFTVSLDTIPSDDVTINLSSTDATEGSVSPTELVFTTLDYNAKSVTVTGIDDGVQDGPQTYMIVTSPASSADTDYANLDASNVSLTNIDNEAGAPGLSVIPTMGLITSEAGGTDTFTVALQSMPNADVTVAVSSDDINEGNVDKASLTFTSVNWETPQTITLTGADDMDIDLDQAYDISLVISSADPAYTGLAPITVSATNQDDEENLYALGKVAYEKVIGGGSCLTCHGSEGLGLDAGQNTPGIFDNPVTEASDCEICGDQTMFEAYVLNSMPTIFGTPADCDADCAKNITLYIYNGFSTVPPGL